MRTKPLRLLAAALLAAACAAPRPSAPAGEAYSEAVEVTNRLEHAVDVRYYLRGGGGPLYLGTVSAGDRRRFDLPPEAGFVFAADADGRRVQSSATAVQIRRVRQPAGRDAGRRPD